MSKVTLNLSVDVELVEIAKERGINMSGLFNTFLENYLLSKVSSDSLITEEDIKKKEIEVETLRSKIKAQEQDNIRGEKLQEVRDKKNYWYDWIVKEIILKDNKPDWIKDIRGFQNIIKTQTGLIVNREEVIKEIEERLKDKEE
jgi:hypothetical protein